MMTALDLLIENGLSDDMLSEVCTDLLKGDAFDDDADKLCCIGLAWSRDDGNKIGPSDCAYERDNTISIGGSEYLILSDDDADAAFDDYLEQMLDEPGMVPGADGSYFDRAAWKRDAKMDGRGSSLASYDGHEHEFCVDGSDWYFLYRIQ
jgi:hypothetical protein